MNALLFSGFLAVQNPVPFEDPTREALRHGSKAMFYVLELDETAKRLEKKYVTDDMRKYAPVVGVTVRVITEKRISYTWRF